MTCEHVCSLGAVRIWCASGVRKFAARFAAWVHTSDQPVTGGSDQCARTREGLANYADQASSEGTP